VSESGGDREEDGDGDGFDPGPDPERARMLRETADEIRQAPKGDLVAAFLYRVSDLYDPDESTSPPEIYRNMRNILRVTERGTLRRDR